MTPSPMTDFRTPGSAARRHYLNTVVTQTLRWHNGQPVHNTEFDECCPDFSCCEPGLYQPDPERRARELQRVIALRDEEMERG